MSARSDSGFGNATVVVRAGSVVGGARGGVSRRACSTLSRGHGGGDHQVMSATHPEQALPRLVDSYGGMRNGLTKNSARFWTDSRGLAAAWTAEREAKPQVTALLRQCPAYTPAHHRTHALNSTSTLDLHLTCESAPSHRAFTPRRVVKADENRECHRSGPGNCREGSDRLSLARSP